MRGRPALVEVTERTDGPEAQVVTKLSWRDQEFVGEATGSVDSDARPRLVGEATLRAVEQLTNGRIGLDLTAVATTSVGTVQVAIVQIKVLESRDLLVGNAVLTEQDPARATAKAILDAINRRLEIVL